MHSRHRLLITGALAAALAVPARGATPDARMDTLDEVVISASLRGATLRELPQSATVLDEGTLQSAGVQHFEDVLGLVPGLSWASGTSRPRYFQLRGIGETEQYQGAPNPSVGFLIDDIDFSGVGMPATLFDLDRIEVLRGPSGTLYGASALAGLISVRSRDPGRRPELGAEVTAGDYSTAALGLVAGDGFDGGEAGWRVAAQRYRSDGFRNNVYLQRKDTNGYEESTVRGKLAWDPSPELHALFTLLYADLGNGYDAWTVDNSRTTRSNQPGRDSQRSTGGSLRLEGASAHGRWLSISSAAKSDIVYSFDGDWGNDPYWGANAPYDYFEGHDRTRRTLAQDLRYIGDGVANPAGLLRPTFGAYVLVLRENDTQLDTWNDRYYGAGQSTLYSDFKSTNAALYGSLELLVAGRGTFTLGLRAEQRGADYSDTADAPFPHSSELLGGGNLSWSWQADAQHQYYATLARGYKAGGFNIGAGIEAAQREFDPEGLWNLELGAQWHDASDTFGLRADAYAMRRSSMQVYNSRQLVPDNPLTYVFYTDNAAHGDNIGFEGELHWRPRARWTLAATGTLQRTRYLGYVNEGLDLRGRAQAYAPAWQLSLSPAYQHPSGFFARVDFAAQDGFYFSSSNDQRAPARTLVNARAGWQSRNWRASLWAHNLFDAHYAVQGYYFGLEPPDYPVKSYLQSGDPLQLGVTLRWDL